MGKVLVLKEYEALARQPGWPVVRHQRLGQATGASGVLAAVASARERSLLVSSHTH